MDAFVVAEKFQQLRIRAEAERPHKHRHRQFTVLIDAHVKHIRRIGLIFQPRAAVRDDGGGEQLFAGGVIAHAIIHARGTHQLRDNDTLRAVDNEGAAVGHEREIPHEHFRLLDFAGFLIQQTRLYPQRSRIGHVPLLALLDGIFWSVVQPVIDELQHQIARIVGNRGHVVEDLAQPLVEEPVIRVLLHLDEVGHFQHLIDLCEAHANRVSQLNRFNIRHRLDHSYSIFIPSHAGTANPLRGGIVAKFFSEPLALLRNLWYTNFAIGSSFP